MPDVVIVGCGPTGVMLANLLGHLGVEVAVLERDTEVYPVPRATHIDEETVRNFRSTGLFAELEPFMTHFGRIEIVDERGRVILSQPVGDPSTPHGPMGSRFFDQPEIERALRAGLARYPCVQLHSGLEVERLQIHPDSITTHAVNPETGEKSRFTSPWLVGCDGGRSVVREAAGISMSALSPKRPWFIVDTRLRDPADASLLPECFRYVFKEDRLTIYAHGMGLNRRWEFQLGDGEDVPATETAMGWISEYIDPAKLEVLRMTPYAHVSLVADRWRDGGLLLAGDAAHMMPPSAGQGMCSGIRDAVNLAWKLERVIRGLSPDSLLDSYEHERSPHVRETLEGTLFIGRRLEANTTLQRWVRRRSLQLVSSVPPVERVLRNRVLRRPILREGCLDRDSSLAGHPLPFVELESACLDELLDYGFALISRVSIPAETRGWCEARGIACFESDVGGWLETKRLDYVLVRPDRQIFSSGGITNLSNTTASFDESLR